jgi:hypothetical protein
VIRGPFICHDRSVAPFNLRLRTLHSDEPLSLSEFDLSLSVASGHVEALGRAGRRRFVSRPFKTPLGGADVAGPSCLFIGAAIRVEG